MLSTAGNGEDKSYDGAAKIAIAARMASYNRHRKTLEPTTSTAGDGQKMLRRATSIFYDGTHGELHPAMKSAGADDLHCWNRCHGVLLSRAMAAC